MRKDSSTRVLVTGGAGFLGAHLCRRLLADGYEVVCVDDFSTGARANVEVLLDHSGFELLRHDITHPLQAQVDIICNLACPASPIHYQNDPVRTMKTGVLGAINVLDLARQNRASVLQASTSEVYGSPLVHPQTEDDWGNVNPIGPRACYNESKRCAETLCFDYRRQYGVRIKLARIFNTYGPGMHADDGRVVSNFMMQALRGEDITLYGDGSQTRSFCYVDDMIDALVRLMGTDDDVTGPVNLGSTEEISIATLAHTVVELVDSRSRILHRPLPGDDPPRRQPDITLARQALGWSPGTPLLQGLTRTASYFEGLLQSPGGALRAVAGAPRA
jgi:UDP-glucuronate decarboxylase